MSVSKADLRALVFSDQDLVDVCADVLTVLSVRDCGVEVREFNELDVTIDRNEHVVTFQGVLSVNDAEVRMTEDRFVELAGSFTAPLTGQPLDAWLRRRARPVRPMPPVGE